MERSGLTGIAAVGAIDVGHLAFLGVGADISAVTRRPNVADLNLNAVGTLGDADARGVLPRYDHTRTATRDQ